MLVTSASSTQAPTLRFGTSGTIKENAAGGFSFELPGGGGIHIDSGGGRFASTTNQSEPPSSTSLLVKSC